MLLKQEIEQGSSANSVRQEQVLFKGLKLVEPLPLTGHPAVVYLRSLSPKSQVTMRGALNRIAGLLTNGECDHLSLNWAKLTYQHTAAVQAALLETCAPATAATRMCALKRTLKECKRLGLISGDQYEAAVDLPSIRVPETLPGRALELSEIEALMRVCEEDTTKQGVRDLALISILRGCGLRRVMVAKLLLEHLEVETGTLRVLKAKGGKNRLVYLSEEGMVYVARWLQVRGLRPGALLCPIRKGGRIEYRCMSGQNVFLIVQKRVEEAGLEKLTPQDFRRTFCSDLFEAGVDAVMIQQLVGHASLQTTAKYDRRKEALKRQAIKNLKFKS